MEPLVHTTADEASALAMENELLRYEAIHLRARLAAAEKAVTKAERALESARPGQPAGGATPAASAAVSAAVSGEEATAREDLVWLLQRLDRSPVGPLLRGRAGFRALRAKYLDGATG